MVPNTIIRNGEGPPRASTGRIGETESPEDFITTHQLARGIELAEVEFHLRST